jgi:streptogramin lyase
MAWQPEANYFTTNSAGQAPLPAFPTNRFFRLLAVDISTNTSVGYTNLLQSYGNLHTIAGNGSGGIDGVNYWRPAYEGAIATNVALSRPHFAMADEVGNVFIVDKGSHSVLKLTPDGRIHTVAGTHLAGNGPDSSAPATQVSLNQPNGLFVQANGTFFILDTGNGKVRRCDTNGTLSTLFSVPGGIAIGRGLWVDDNAAQVVFCDGNSLKAWNPTNGVTILNTNFVELGNLIPTSKKKNVIVTDRGDDKVYKVDISGSGLGSVSVFYGKGHGNAVVDGTWAVTNCFNGVRGVWRLPTDGYLFALHEGTQILYVDPADIVHVLVQGEDGAHSGDGQWFYSPGYKIDQARSVTMDSQGNILIVESDFGYVRKIDFQRLTH